MPNTPIITGASLPLPRRSGDGGVLVPLSDGVSIKVPQEHADAPVGDAAFEKLEEHFLDRGNAKDFVRLWVLLRELRDNNRTLGQLADNESGIRDLLASATYSIVRTLP